MQEMHKINKKNNFTLVELMVTIVIIGVLIAVLSPAFSRLLTGNAVGAAERMIAGQLSMARVEAARRRCEIAIVIYHSPGNPSLPKSAALHAAYKKDDDWEWLPGSQITWLPNGAIINRLFFGTIADIPNNKPTDSDEYPLDETVENLNVDVKLADSPTVIKEKYPAIIFKPNGRPAQNTVLTLIEAAFLPSASGDGTIQIRNENYCRVFEISQYTGRVTISEKTKE